MERDSGTVVPHKMMKTKLTVVCVVGRNGLCLQDIYSPSFFISGQLWCPIDDPACVFLFFGTVQINKAWVCFP